jgi:hypothetical protein
MLCGMGGAGSRPGGRPGEQGGDAQRGGLARTSSYDDDDEKIKVVRCCS